jgi:hypothetical protein
MSTFKTVKILVLVFGGAVGCTAGLVLNLFAVYVYCTQYRTLFKSYYYFSSVTVRYNCLQTLDILAISRSHMNYLLYLYPSRQ